MLIGHCSAIVVLIFARNCSDHFLITNADAGQSFSLKPTTPFISVQFFLSQFALFFHLLQIDMCIKI